MEWEAGDAKRSRAAGVAQRHDADGAGGGARRKADGTLDRRFLRAKTGGRGGGSTVHTDWSLPPLRPYILLAVRLNL